MQIEAGQFSRRNSSRVNADCSVFCIPIGVLVSGFFLTLNLSNCQNALIIIAFHLARYMLTDNAATADATVHYFQIDILTTEQITVIRIVKALTVYYTDRQTDNGAD